MKRYISLMLALLLLFSLGACGQSPEETQGEEEYLSVQEPAPQEEEPEEEPQQEEPVEELPQAFKDYIAFLEKELGVPVKYLSIGPDRDQTITRSI